MDNIKQNTIRNISLDILKILLAFMIIGIHSGFLKEISIPANYFTENGLFRTAVPIFFLISGYYYFPAFTNKKIGSWFKKLIFLYAFWMAFYGYSWVKPINSSFLDIIKNIPTILIGYYHLWYIPGVIGSALLMNLFHRRHAATLLAFSFTLFFIGSTIQYIGGYHLIQNTMVDKIFNYPWSHRNFIFLGFPLFSIGYLINKFNISERVSFKYIFIAIAIFMLILIAETYFNYESPIKKPGFDNYFSLIFICPAIFIFFLKYKINGDGKCLAMYSSGIYFIHPFIMELVKKISLTAPTPTELTVIAFLFSAVASFFLISLNKKIKIIL